MWWKLALLGLIAAGLVIAVQPIRTHAEKIDIPPNGQLPAMPRHSLLDIFSAMYVTPTSLLMSAVIVAIAGYFAFKIVRS